MNMILFTDSYKLSHWKQYPKGTEYVSSYIESRGGDFPKSLFNGLQIFLKEWLSKPITLENIEEAEEAARLHGLPFNKEGWMYILNQHGGYLPIEIEAVPEGTVLDVKNVLVQVVNTDPDCYWLTSYLETALMQAVWYPTTVGTLSYFAKQAIWNALLKSSDDPKNQILYKLHDFGFRGVSSYESAGIGGCAHLINFRGTDTIAGLMYARKYYNEHMAGHSISASEHSTISAYGRDGEVAAHRNMLQNFAKPGAMMASVSDTWDIYRCANEIWGKELKDEVLNSGATIVVRPDSGNPLVVPIDIIRILSERFGYTTNAKGFKLLPSCIRVIQGDGINLDSLKQILTNLLDAGFSADNLAFGMGGGLLQQVNRDTMKFAMKCSAIKINGYWQDVYKDPATDKGKQSKRGRLALTHPYGFESQFCTDRRENVKPENNLLVPVYRNGDILKTYSFAEIRERASKEFV